MQKRGKGGKEKKASIKENYYPSRSAPPPRTEEKADHKDEDADNEEHVGKNGGGISRGDRPWTGWHKWQRRWHGGCDKPEQKCKRLSG